MTDELTDIEMCELRHRVWAAVKNMAEHDPQMFDSLCRACNATPLEGRARLARWKARLQSSVS